jgi:hypothetical protein
MDISGQLWSLAGMPFLTDEECDLHLEHLGNSGFRRIET